jgi:hypothetical protein
MDMLNRWGLLGTAAGLVLIAAGAGPALAQSDEVSVAPGDVVTAGGAAVVGSDGAGIGVSDVGIGGPGGDDATLAFGVGNEVASAHLDAAVSGLAFAVTPEGEAGGASVRTGSITDNTVTTMSGANRVALNTGTANQGRALAIAAHVSSSD